MSIQCCTLQDRPLRFQLDISLPGQPFWLQRKDGSRPSSWPTASNTEPREWQLYPWTRRSHAKSNTTHNPCPNTVRSKWVRKPKLAGRKMVSSKPKINFWGPINLEFWKSLLYTTYRVYTFSASNVGPPRRRSWAEIWRRRFLPTQLP